MFMFILFEVQYYLFCLIFLLYKNTLCSQKTKQNKQTKKSPNCNQQDFRTSQYRTAIQLSASRKSPNQKTVARLFLRWTQNMKSVFQYHFASCILMSSPWCPNRFFSCQEEFSQRCVSSIQPHFQFICNLWFGDLYLTIEFK